MSKTIIDAIHEVLLKLFIENKGEDARDFESIDDMQHLEQALSETIDSEGSEGAQGEITPQDIRQLRLTPSLDARILRLLMQMSLGIESAIEELVLELLNKKDPNLIKAVTKAMEKGINGAELVLRKTLEQGNAYELESIKSLIHDVSPEVEHSLRYQSPRPVPRPYKDPRDIF